MNERIIVFGAAGQVGADCVVALRQAGYQVDAITRAQLDFSDGDGIEAVMDSSKPSIVVNACAYTAVDKAEDELSLAEKINHHGVGVLAKACRKHEALLIHLSTDYVFDGRASEPYTELSPVNPLGAYGQTKWRGEEAITQTLEKHVILRTSWVFGEQGNNFVKTMLRLGESREELSVVSDQVGRPTYVGHIVDVILVLIDKYLKSQPVPFGLYHCSSSGVVSWYEFAKAVFSEASRLGVLNNVPQVHAIPSSDYPTPAPRPAFSVLDTSKLEKLLGYPMPEWKQGLLEFLKHS